MTQDDVDPAAVRRVFLLVMGGGAAASYYAARHVGLPLLTTLRRRRTGPDQ